MLSVNDSVTKEMVLDATEYLRNRGSKIRNRISF